jgi:hypothetical protein
LPGGWSWLRHLQKESFCAIDCRLTAAFAFVTFRVGLAAIGVRAASDAKAGVVERSVVPLDCGGDPGEGKGLVKFHGWGLLGVRARW